MPLMLAIAAAIVKRIKAVPTTLLKVRTRMFGLATVLYRNLHHSLDNTLVPYLLRQTFRKRSLQRYNDVHGQVGKSANKRLHACAINQEKRLCIFGTSTIICMRVMV